MLEVQPGGTVTGAAPWTSVYWASGLTIILETLEKAGVNLEYMHGFTLRKEGKGVLAFRFDDPDRAIAALQEKGINPERSVDLFERLQD